MTEPTVTPQQVLIAHQRAGAGNCTAGCRSPLGTSFADHQLAELRAAGYAIVRDYAPTVTIPAEQRVRPAVPDLCGAPHLGRGVSCARIAGHAIQHGAEQDHRLIEWPL